jgi:hypothetical protein
MVQMGDPGAFQFRKELWLNSVRAARKTIADELHIERFS